ncbi:hypothetical protein HMPREF0620_0569 [Parascardovia denticolens DSM 10105 = JCM 12538]|uniref:Uncharacterized protein n=1 Tax=Parascardovia denticolens DSM 10105 = JCM 12538 TaxID=864564 RepID=E6K183_PARDN|nr:hypothetical protein HMPREF0620_0569 [Parascardovia denticolens DSM 10105 = JCM 12538]
MPNFQNDSTIFEVCRTKVIRRLGFHKLEDKVNFFFYLRDYA